MIWGLFNEDVDCSSSIIFIAARGEFKLEPNINQVDDVESRFEQDCLFSDTIPFRSDREKWIKGDRWIKDFINGRFQSRYRFDPVRQRRRGFVFVPIRSNDRT